MFFLPLRGRLAEGCWGIDLGTANTVVYVEGRGVVIQEPSIIAVNEQDKVLAIGNSAKEMLGRTPGSIRIRYPLQEGVIADFEATRSLLQHFISRTHRFSRWGLRPVVLIGIPTATTTVERKAVEEAAIQAGADARVHLIEEPVAAALGAGIDISEPHGRMIVDIGGGTTDVAIISCGGVVTCQMSKVAGNVVDDAIQRSLRQRYNLLIGERTAERIKIEAGSATRPANPNETVSVSGRDIATGLPVRLSVRLQEIQEMMETPIAEMIRTIHTTIERCPPDLLVDILEDGLLLTGGGACLEGMDDRIEQETGLPVRVAGNALTAVAEGTGKALSYVRRGGRLPALHGTGIGTSIQVWS